jgi:hypothetical protein
VPQRQEQEKSQAGADAEKNFGHQQRDAPGDLAGVDPLESKKR